MDVFFTAKYKKTPPKKQKPNLLGEGGGGGGFKASSGIFHMTFIAIIGGKYKRIQVFFLQENLTEIAGNEKSTLMLPTKNYNR